MPTIRDVAARAGVSTAAVSYALNRPERVTAGLRARVEAAARALDYQPDGTARALRTRRSHLVSLIVPDVANHFYGTLARGVQDAIRSRDLHIVLGSTDAQSAEERYFVRAAVMQRAAGAIIVPLRLDEQAILQACGPDLRVIVIGPGDATRLPHVHIDDVDGARQGVAYLLATGRRRVAYIAGLPDTPPTERRWQGYVRAHQQAGLPVDPSRRVVADFQCAGGEAAMARLLESGTDVDAIFAANDLIAIGALRVARRRGLRVPEDIAIVGFDDIEEAEIVEPALTTVRQPAYQTGWCSAQMLLECIDRRSTSVPSVTLSCALVRRASA